ncbi:MAG: GNAT family N-acetyltransferase [Alphaproteobacteria bacterium]|nr:GNAT family N-acetyltransferase [Alphaproteobacteria bacterium]
MAQPDNASLRSACEADLAALSDLCFRSKAVWGYDAAFMEACRAELTLAPRDLLESNVQVVESGGRIVGVVQVAVTGRESSLEKLFVAPEALRAGAGRKLFAWAVETARKRGARSLAIESDPGAADFYRRMGARDAGLAPSGSIPGRWLPLLKLDL